MSSQTGLNMNFDLLQVNGVSTQYPGNRSSAQSQTIPDLPAFDGLFQSTASLSSAYPRGDSALRGRHYAANLPSYATNIGWTVNNSDSRLNPLLGSLNSRSQAFRDAINSPQPSIDELTTLQGFLLPPQFPISDYRLETSLLEPNRVTCQFNVPNTHGVGPQRYVLPGKNFNTIDRTHELNQPPIPTYKKLRVCDECKATGTPQWRRGPNGEVNLCNACGLRFEKRTKKKGKTTNFKNKPKRRIIKNRLKL
ncbi:transcription factor stalky-like [Zophobas morio]|uniref:transcription factor stalky-like n=1 Tax=Zophobas morio TaxID=2755281 RepID=UPI0030837257